MNLEQQVISFELAKKLHDLGVNYPSLFYWGRDENVHENIHGYFLDYELSNDVSAHYPKPLKIYSAYSVAELGHILPEEVHRNGIHGHLFFYKGIEEVGSFTISYCTLEQDVTPCIIDFHEANGRANMLIYLIENNIVKVEDINK